MKFIKLSMDEKYVMLGESNQDGSWYTVEPNVSRFIKSFKPGDEVTIKSEKVNNKDHLKFIQKANGNVNTYSQEPREPGSPPPAPSATVKRTYGKSPEEQETIKRQAVLHATSRALIALSGSFPAEEIEVVSTKIYNHFWKLVNDPR